MELLMIGDVVVAGPEALIGLLNPMKEKKQTFKSALRGCTTNMF
tara:strand:- start:255 stop:386 length:132 start_codon:yes stop_codon:yes gene_type:complete